MLVVVALAAVSTGTYDCGGHAQYFGSSGYGRAALCDAAGGSSAAVCNQYFVDDPNDEDFFNCVFDASTNVCGAEGVACTPPNSACGVETTDCGDENTADCIGKYETDGTTGTLCVLVPAGNGESCAKGSTLQTCDPSAGDGGNGDYPAPSPGPPSPSPSPSPTPAPTPAPDNTDSPTERVKAYIKKLIDGGNTDVKEETYNDMTLNVPAETNSAMDATVKFTDTTTACQAEKMTGLIRDHMKNEYPGRDVTVSECTDMSCTEVDVCPAESRRLARAAQAGRRGRRATERTATINVAAGGLSGGEIAGIVIGSIVGVVLIGGLIYSAVTGCNVLTEGKDDGYYKMGDNGIQM